MDRCSVDKKSSSPSTSLGTGHEKLLDQMTEHLYKASVINEEEKEKAVVDDEDIKVIGESSRSGYSANAILKDAAVTRSLCDLLLTNKPNMREHVAMFQSLFMNTFLNMWVDINSERLQSNDVKSFQVIYQKLLKKIESTEARNRELSNENSKLKLEINQLTAEEDRKYDLKNAIIAAVKKSVKRNNVNPRLKDYESVKCQTDFPIEKDIMDLKKYESVECQTDFPSEKENKMNQITNNRELYHPLGKEIKKELINEVKSSPASSNINGACSNGQVQEPMYIDLEDVPESLSHTPSVDSSGSLPVSEVKPIITAAETSTDVEHPEREKGESAKHQKFEKKKGKRRRTLDCTPKLTVIGVEDTMVECQLESTKGKTVTFKFDYTDTSPEEIANKLVITNLFAENHAEIFTEFIQEVIRQLKENPDKIPVIQFLESTVPSSPPTLRRQTFKDHLDLEKSECSVVSQTPLIQLSSEPSTSKKKSQSSLKNSNKKRKQDF